MGKFEERIQVITKLNSLAAEPGEWGTGVGRGLMGSHKEAYEGGKGWKGNGGWGRGGDGEKRTIISSSPKLIS